MRVLLIGETGLGKTVTALTLSQFFNTTYFDTEEGTLLWLNQFNLKKCRLLKITKWDNSLMNIANLVSNSELVVLDSLSTLMDHYQDYLQQYVRNKQEFPMPTATGVVKLKVDPEFVVLPMQLYQLLYDTMLNVVDQLIRVSNNCIITMHPIETRQLSIEGKVIQSHGRYKFVQSIYRRMDIILHYVRPMQCNVVKCRGLVEDVGLVNPIEFLKSYMGVKENGNRDDKGNT